MTTGPHAHPTDTKATADALAAKLIAAGLTVERKDYPPVSYEPDIGSRRYVIVTDGNDRAECQVNDRLPNGAANGYGGPNGLELLARVRALLKFPPLP